MTYTSTWWGFVLPRKFKHHLHPLRPSWPSDIRGLAMWSTTIFKFGNLRAGRKEIIQSSDRPHRWLPRVSEWVAGPGNQTPCPPLQALRALEIIIKKWKFWPLISINRFITSCNILPENPVLFFHIQDMSDSNLAICCHNHQLLKTSTTNVTAAPLLYMSYKCIYQ